MNTPVLFLVFNRPDTTRIVFDAIRNAQPSRLYIAADGPRINRPDEAESCAEVRSIVANVDWPCEIKTLFRDENLGCKSAVSSAIDWFFEHEAEGIILEDDCLPDATFFPYCSELLEKYRNEPSVMAIGGNYFSFNESRKEVAGKSYFFTKHVEIWGWATWRRAWKTYDVEIKNWALLPEDWLMEIGGNSTDFKQYFKSSFDSVYRGEIDTWDFQWVFNVWYHNGLSALPTRNLVSNIGFNADATHTKVGDGFLDNVPLQPMKFPLAHPVTIERSLSMDKWLDRKIYGIGISLTGKIMRKLSSFRKRLLKKER